MKLVAALGGILLSGNPGAIRVVRAASDPRLSGTPGLPPIAKTKDEWRALLVSRDETLPELLT